MEKHTRQQKNTLYVALSTSFITTFMGSALNLSIPDMERFFGIDAEKAGWIVTVYMLTCAVMAVPVGIIADRGKRKKVLCLGTVLFTAACIGAALSAKLWLLLICRFVQASGASMIFCTNIAVLTAAFGKESRGRVLGLTACFNYLGLSAGPVIGGVINGCLGWQAVFLAAAAVSALSIAGSFYSIYLDKKEKEAARKPDRESRQDMPVLNLKNIRGRSAFNMANFAAFLNYGATYGLTYMISLYLRSVLGFSAGKSGIILAVNTVIMSVLSVVAGRISDRKNPAVLSAAGAGLCSAAMGIVWLRAENLSLAIIVIALAISGAGSAFFSAPNTRLIMSEVPETEYSRTSALMSSMRSAGHTLFMAVITISISLNAAGMSLQSTDAERMAPVMETVFFVMTAACILGNFMAIRSKV